MVNTFCEAPARFWSGSESGYKRDELVTTSHRIGSFSILSELTRFPKQYYPTAKGLDLREYRQICHTEGLREKKRRLLWRKNASRRPHACRSWVRAAPTCACPRRRLTPGPVAEMLLLPHCSSFLHFINPSHPYFFMLYCLKFPCLLYLYSPCRLDYIKDFIGHWGEEYMSSLLNVL